MNKTLDYILKCAQYNHPCIQGRFFREKEDIDLSFLLNNGFLVEKNTRPQSIRMYGESFPLFFDYHTHEYFFIDCGDKTTVSMEDVIEYELLFSPFANLLSETYHCDVSIEERIPNFLWYLGIPGGGLIEIYLVRNPGTNPAVENVLDNLEEGSMVLWFGTMPIRKTRKAKLYRLSDYIFVDGKVLRHNDQWPPAINESAEVIQIKQENAIIIKGDNCDIYFDGKPLINLKVTKGINYIIRMIQADGKKLDPLVVIMPNVFLRKNVGSILQKGSYVFERPLDVYSKEDFAIIRNNMDELKTMAEDDRAKNNIGRAHEREAEYKMAESFLNKKCNRPGGKSIKFSDPRKNIKRGINSALEVVRKKLIKHKRADIAKHIEDSFIIGKECYYAPEGQRKWQIHKT